MKEINKYNDVTHDDEIDLFELFEQLWSAKLVIVLITLASLILGGLLVTIKEPTYESKISLTVMSLPPFYSKERVVSEFEGLFFNENSYQQWLKEENNPTFSFEDISRYQQVDNFVVLKDHKDLIVNFVSDKNNKATIVVKSEDHTFINDIFAYSLSVSQILDAKYSRRAQQELALIESRFQDLTATNVNVIDRILSVDRYVSELSSQATTMSVSPPSMPKLTSIKPKLALVLFGFMGIILGSIFILLKNAIKHRKNINK